ncbi:MAG TPA: hypothetical protein VKZ49_19105 [Polyangiaceae bacterium]|nr:hypothetical protein [Polyangiaceae bacterium]
MARAPGASKNRASTLITPGGDYVLELWGGTAAGTVILRQEITSTVCP